MQSAARNQEQSEGGEQPAKHGRDGWVRYIVVLQGSGRSERVNQNGGQTDGDHESPANLPVPADLDPEHEFDIFAEVIDSVEPSDACHLASSHNVDDKV